MEGRELSLNEVREMKSNLNVHIRNRFNLDDKSYNAILEYTSINSQDQNGDENIRMIRRNKENKISIRQLKKTLRRYRISEASIRGIVKLIKNEISLNKKLQRLQTMQRLFKYWHIVHLPFALIMLVIMIIHVGITLAFGAKWIF
jgi:bisphosphoglycerate-dependent phosphoglycerate mutase